MQRFSESKKLERNGRGPDTPCTPQLMRSWDKMSRVHGTAEHMMHCNTKGHRLNAQKKKEKKEMRLESHVSFEDAILIRCG